MNKMFITHPIIALILAGVVVFPIGICLILAVASLLMAMGDLAGGGALRWVALGFGIVWILNLIILIIALAINALSDSNDSNSNES